MPPPEPIARRAARVLLLDDDDRLLLFEGHDETDRAAPRWWFTVGGGIEPGETDVEAARREVAEETGLSDLAITGPVWRSGPFDWTFEGVAYRSSETFFLARTSSRSVDTSGLTAVEGRCVVDHRWWSAEELQATTAVVYPPGLGKLLESLLRDGPPARPLSIRG